MHGSNFIHRFIRKLQAKKIPQKLGFRGANRRVNPTGRIAALRVRGSNRLVTVEGADETTPGLGLVLVLGGEPQCLRQLSDETTSEKTASGDA